jgi:hypothetical protein
MGRRPALINEKNVPGLADLAERLSELVPGFAGQFVRRPRANIGQICPNREAGYIRIMGGPRKGGILACLCECIRSPVMVK